MPPCLQSGDQINSRERGGWRQGNKQTCEDGDGQSENQGVNVDADGRTSRKAAYAVEQSDTAHRKYKPGNAAESCENQVFRDELPHQAAFACSQANA